MNALIIENGYATIATPGGGKIETTRLNFDRYIRIDDGRQYPQLCAGAARSGATLIYTSDKQLAKDCGARLYKTRAGFESAVARLASSW